MAAVFVDREDSLSVIGSVARRLEEGSSSVLVVEGDSGIGKSSLLAEVHRRWSGGACRVVLVSCVPGLGRGGEYGPFLDALDELSSSSRGGKRRSMWARAMGRGAAAATPVLLSAAIPGFGGVVEAWRAAAEAAVGTGSVPGDSLGPPRMAMTYGIVEALLAEARDGLPLLLLIDDVQLFDEGSRELLNMLLRNLEGEPLSLVLGIGSYASSTVSGAQVEQLLHVWERRHNLLVARHRVPPLPDWAVGELVSVRLQGQDVPVGFAEQVHSLTAGRPVFVDQVLKLWRPGYGTDVPLPDELPDAFRERFLRIDPEVRELLVLGATAGEFFFSHTLAEVTGIPQIRVQDLLHRVGREHGLVRERRRADMPRWADTLHVDWYDFEHRALQSCIRQEQQDEGALLLRHARIAEALERLPRSGEDLPREVRVMIAGHLRAAGPARAAASSAAHYRLARSVAVEELSFIQAEKYCQTALDSARQLPEGSPERDRRLVEAAELLLSLTEVRWKGSGSRPEAPGIDTLAAEAEESARRLGDRLLIARTALLRGKTLLAVRGLEPSLEKLHEAVTLARECGPEGTEVLYVALVEYGRQLPKRDLEAGLGVLFEAEELYASSAELGDVANPVLQHARNLNEMQIGVNLFDAGRFDEALQRLLRCVERLSGEVMRGELPVALNYLAQLRMALGDTEEAEAVLARALGFEEEHQEKGESISGWHAYNNALLALIASRTPERAPEALWRIRAAWLETQETWLVNLVPIVRNLYVDVLTAVGEDSGQALRLIGDTLVETETTQMARSRIAAFCLRSRLRLEEGDVRNAVDDARAAYAILVERGAMPALRTEEVLYDVSRALAAAGDDEEAGSLLVRARAEVSRKADSIGDPRRRDHFLNAVPLNQALFADVPSVPAESAVTVRDQGDSRTEE
ncbi:AAA family ATPase [Streptomyces sp. NBC_00075]|uniref:AAA family ATPase n=1 Tax=Streptomyces sp. NBC_00075 TaxID=2975641 RepID=UPI0032462E57